MSNWRSIESCERESNPQMRITEWCDEDDSEIEAGDLKKKPVDLKKKPADLIKKPVDLKKKQMILRSRWLPCL